VSGEISQISLARLFLLSLVFGFVACAVYDLFRIRRIAIRIPILWHFEDFFFMLACAACFCVLFFVKSSGKVRGFAFGTALVGAGMYRYTLGRLVMRSAERIIALVKRILRRVLLPPVRLLKRIFRAFWTKISDAFGRVALKIKKKRSERLLREIEDSVLVGFSRRRPKKKKK
jgi:hypothetical protein